MMFIACNRKEGPDHRSYEETPENFVRINARIGRKGPLNAFVRITLRHLPWLQHVGALASAVAVAKAMTALVVSLTGGPIMFPVLFTIICGMFGYRLFLRLSARIFWIAFTCWMIDLRGWCGRILTDSAFREEEIRTQETATRWTKLLDTRVEWLQSNRFGRYTEAQLHQVRFTQRVPA